MGLNPPKEMFKYAVIMPIISIRPPARRRIEVAVLEPSVNHDIFSPPMNS